MQNKDLGLSIIIVCVCLSGSLWVDDISDIISLYVRHKKYIHYNYLVNITSRSF